jgi:hypothetical protein
MVNADYRTIMLKAKTKYNMLLSSKDRPFGTPLDEEQQVVALKAELEQFKDTNFKLTKQLKSHKETSQSNPSQANESTNMPSTSNQTTRNQKNTSKR